VSAVSSPWPPRDRVLVFVDHLDQPVLDAGDRRHLERSLRIRTGEVISIGDGAGRWRAVRFGPELDPAEPTNPIHQVPRPTPALTVAFAPVKGDRSDLIVQKLTELGIDRIVPLVTERSVVRWDAERAARHHDRHERIVREAAMQSRNPWLPRVELPVALSDFVAAEPGAALADPDGEPPGPGLATVAIGPEGGFSPDELQARTTVRLPGRVLRTETAAITAAVVLAGARLPGPNHHPA
jgi:16S rRNA (uracil1498-N3)-methyltransferase